MLITLFHGARVAVIAMITCKGYAIHAIREKRAADYEWSLLREPGANQIAREF
jgi:hypothetical protein